jgi:hypothetical protein
MKKPDISSAPRPAELQGVLGIEVHSRTEDGRLLDADGNEISIEDLINQPGGIRPGPASILGETLPDGAQGDPAHQGADPAEQEEDR